MGAPRAAWARGVDTHREIRGRRWRVSDPRIPEPLRQRLVNELMAARRAVKAARDAADERRARARVDDAKVALGERGLRWWLEAPEPGAWAERVRATYRALRREDEACLDDVGAVVSASRRDVEDTLDG